MAILDGRDEIGISFDLGRQFVSHDCDQIIAGQQIGRVTVCQTLLSQKHQRDHH